MTDRLNKLKKNCKTCFISMLVKSCNRPIKRDGSCSGWMPNNCKYCGGALVERHYKGKTYFYCYSCHMEFERGLL